MLNEITNKDIENVIHNIAVMSDMWEVEKLYSRIEAFSSDMDCLSSKMTYLYLLGVVRGKRSERSKKVR